jgi:outer membrane protein OmpA-like peptidoglycan-associated protein
MCRSPERDRARAARLGALLAVALALGAAAAGPAWGQQATPAPSASVPPAPSDAVGAVEDVVGEVESLDGTESESRKDRTVTVTLTSDVLFAFDKAEVTAKAGDRLRRLAAKLQAEAAGGTVRIEGHTDDQGSDAYNQGLSQRRAEAVRSALARLLGGEGLDLGARGFGERRPRVPNVVNGTPSEKNRARNRRVEIVYDVGKGP